MKPAPTSPRGPAGILRTLLLWFALLAAATPFLPFAANTAPWEVVEVLDGTEAPTDWALCGAGLGFFTALPMAVVLLWWRAKDQVPAGMRICAVTVSFLTITVTVMIVTLLWADDLTAQWHELAIFAPALVLVIGGTWLVVRTPDSSRASVLALEVAYLTHATTLLAIFTGASEPGWWVTLVAVLGVGGEIAMNYRRPTGATAVAVPSPVSVR
jgi:hypothetical protein